MQNEKMMYICEDCKDTYASDLEDASKNICPTCKKMLKPMGISRTEWRALNDDKKEEFKKALLQNDPEVEKLTLDLKKEQIQKMEKIIVTTCDLKQDYDVIGPVYIQINNRGNQYARLSEKHKQIIESKRKDGQLSGDRVGGLELMEVLFVSAAASSGHQIFDNAFFIAVEELKEKAMLMGADAIVGMKQDLDLDSNGFQYFYLQMYGTAVKFK